MVMMHRLESGDPVRGRCSGCCVHCSQVLPQSCRGAVHWLLCNEQPRQSRYMATCEAVCVCVCVCVCVFVCVCACACVCAHSVYTYICIALFTECISLGLMCLMLQTYIAILRVYFPAHHKVHNACRDNSSCLTHPRCCTLTCLCMLHVANKEMRLR